MTKKTKFSSDNFWQLAQERLADPNLTDEEVKKRDLSIMYDYELDWKVKNGELINHGISGPVRTGKSTIAGELVWKVKRLIEKHHKVSRPMSNKNIFRDQNEYFRTVKKRPIEFLHECDAIDEWNEMETGGFNSTAEAKFAKTFSDVQAGRYYHRFACSPTNITDDNADIILQVIPGSRNGAKTMCLLYYRINTAFFNQPVLLGHIIVDVSKTLQAPWYKEYLRKKTEKWELCNKHGVLARELEYARVVLTTYSDLKNMARLGLAKRSIIKTTFMKRAREESLNLSILGVGDLLETLVGMCELTFELYKAQIKLKKDPTNTTIIDAVEYIEKGLQHDINYQIHLCDLWNEYQRIDE